VQGGPGSGCKRDVTEKTDAKKGVARWIPRAFGLTRLLNPLIWEKSQYSALERLLNGSTYAIMNSIRAYTVRFLCIYLERLAMKKSKRTLERDFTRAAIYIRVSTDEQVTSGLGMESQEAACRALAAARGWEVQAAHIFVDGGVSGTTPPEGRAGMKRLLSQAAEGAFANVIFSSLDRLARKTSLILDFVESAGNEGLGVCFCRESAIDTTTAAGRMVLSVLAAFSQFERDLISERTLSALAQKRVAGWIPGRPPYGYDHDGEVASIEVVPEQASVVREIFQLRREGNSLRAIARFLNTNGIKPPRGTSWHGSSINQVLSQSETYRGAGAYPAILD
jgi:site-specific DNA recombinase